MKLFSGRKVRRGVEAASATFDAGDYARAVELARDAAVLAQENRRYMDEAYAAIVQSRAYTALGDLDEAGRVLRTAARPAAERDRSEANAIIWWQLEQQQAMLHDLQMRTDDAIAAYGRAIAAVDQASRIPGIQLFGAMGKLAHYRRQSMLGIADIMGRSGHIAEATKQCDELVNSAWRDKDGQVLLCGLQLRSWLMRMVNDKDEAARSLEVALESVDAVDFGDTHRSAVITSLVRLGIESAQLQVLAGNDNDIDEGFGQAREAVTQAEMPDLLVEVVSAHTAVALFLGRNEQALELATELRSVHARTSAMTFSGMHTYAQALAANGKLPEAMACLTDLLPQLEELNQPITAFHTTLLAASVSHKLDDAAGALQHIRRAIRGYGAISAGVGTSTTRTQFLTGDVDQKATCLAVVTNAARCNVPDAGLVALEVMETWREDTLAGMLRANHVSLPDDLQDLVSQIDALRDALAEPPPVVSMPDAFPGRARREEQADARLTELRAKLARAVGEGFARSYVPTPVDGERIVRACGDRGLLSITTTEDSTMLSGVVVWMIPGESPAVRGFQLSAEASGMVRDLATGQVTADLARRTAFAQAWEAVRDELSDVLLPARLREWLAGDASELIACTDGVLRNLPVAALPVGEDTVVADHVVVNRLPLLRLVDEKPVHGLRKPARVLGCFEEKLAGSVRERETLRELHASGEVQLTEVDDPAELLAMLQRQEFDLLVLSTHGSGAGLDYRFHLPRNDLSVVSLMRSRIPPNVVAAACYSGIDAGTDATGALALFLSSGAHTVATGSWALPDERTGLLLSRVYRESDGQTALSLLINRAQRAGHHMLSDVSPLAWAGLITTSLGS